MPSQAFSVQMTRQPERNKVRLYKSNTSQINVHKGLFLLMSQVLDELLYFLWNSLTLQENLRPSLPLASGHSSLIQTAQRLSSIKGLLWLKKQKAKNITRGEKWGLTKFKFTSASSLMLDRTAHWSGLTSKLWSEELYFRGSEGWRGNREEEDKHWMHAHLYLDTFYFRHYLII